MVTRKSGEEVGDQVIKLRQHVSVFRFKYYHKLDLKHATTSNYTFLYISWQTLSELMCGSVCVCVCVWAGGGRGFAATHDIFVLILPLRFLHFYSSER